MAFASLDDYYTFAEQDTEYPINHTVLRDLWELEQSLENPDSKIACAAESMIYSFKVYTEEGSSIDPKSVIPLTDLSRVRQHGEYFKHRAEECTNPRLKGRYFHVLWLANKDNRNAQGAIDSYLTALKDGLKKDRERYFDDFFIKHFCALITISEGSRLSREEILKCFLDCLDTPALGGFAKVRIIEFLLASNRKKNPGIYDALDQYCTNVVSENIYPDATERYLHSLVSLSPKLNRSAKAFHEKLGELYLQQSKAHEGSFLVEHFYRKAFLAYKQAGNAKVAEEISVRLQRAKPTFRLKGTPFSFSDPSIDDFVIRYREMIKGIVSTMEDDDIYRFLITAPNLLPRAEYLANHVRMGGILDLCSVTTFDRNLNVKSSEKDQGGGINFYSLWIQNFTCEFLRYTFVEGIAAQKLSAESLISYLRRHTWYGVPFTYRDADDKEQGFDWIELLTPALQNYFAQARQDIEAQSTDSLNYVLSSDSLTIKFEGLLRQFSNLLGAQTIEIAEEGSSERISFDKLLGNQKIIEILPPDDHAFLRYLFTGVGLNLRNDIAHSFYPARNYSPAWMWLLITAALRLGNFRFAVTESIPT